MKYVRCPLGSPCLIRAKRLAFHCLTVDGAVLQPARSHAKYKRTAGTENADDRGQHSAAAGRAASDPGGAPEGPGSEPAGAIAAEECV